MKLYVAVIHDYHGDPIIRVFSTLEAAIAWARKAFQEFTIPEEIEEFHRTPEHECPWYAESCGEDYAWVEVTTLDEP